MSESPSISYYLPRQVVVGHLGPDPRAIFYTFLKIYVTIFVSVSVITGVFREHF